LGEQFLDAATAASHFIAEHPEAYQVLHRDVRRAPLRQFPFGLLFRQKGSKDLAAPLGGGR